MPRIINPQYRDDNGASRYPFADTTSLVATDAVAISPDLFVDAMLHIPAADTVARISAIRTSATEISVTVTAGPQTATATVSLPDPTPYLQLLTPDGKPAGLLLADADILATLQGWPSGLHTFSAEFVASVCLLGADLGVTGLQAASGAPLTNDVWLVGEDGIILSADDNDVIRVDIVGEPLINRRLCDTTPGFQARRFLRTINEQIPDQYQDMRLVIGRANTLRPALRIGYENGEIVLSIAGR